MSDCCPPQICDLKQDAVQADDRRIAEAHYKLALTLHFLELPERALEHANKAVAVCNARLARLSPAQGAVDSPAEPSPEVWSPLHLALWPVVRSIKSRREILTYICFK